MRGDIAEVREYLNQHCGDLVDRVYDSDLRGFINAAAKSQCYPLSDDDPDWLSGNTPELFRGYFMALAFFGRLKKND